jgi:hypothetical protein
MHPGLVGGMQSSASFLVAAANPALCNLASVCGLLESREMSQIEDPQIKNRARSSCHQGSESRRQNVRGP